MNTLRPQLIHSKEAARLASLLDKLANAVRPIERRLGIDLGDLAELHEDDLNHPAVKLNTAISDANILLGEMVDVAEELNKSRAKAGEFAG